jgi:hypothetical protein
MSLNRSLVAASISLSIGLYSSIAAGFDEPPVDSTLAQDQAKAVADGMKRDANAVADAAKVGAKQVADRAKAVAHEVAAATQEGARQIATTAKRGSDKVKAAVTGDKSATPP